MKSCPSRSAPFYVILALATTWTLAGVALVLAPGPASAQVATHHTVVKTDKGVVRSSTVVVDRSRAGWWHTHPDFVAYHGPRPGYYYAPGYGYHRVPAAYVHTTWVVGRTFPATFRRYVVINPVGFGLAPPPPGCGWYYAGSNFVLVRHSSGVIVQSVAGGW